jgi:hypothetical protein
MYSRDMLSLFRSFITRVVPVPGQRQAVVLGRWGIQYDPRIIDCKVFQANEDHCGCCAVPSEVAVTVAVTAAVTAENKMKVDEKGEEYLVPYVM